MLPVPLSLFPFYTIRISVKSFFTLGTLAVLRAVSFFIPKKYDFLGKIRSRIRRQSRLLVRFHGNLYACRLLDVYMLLEIYRDGVYGKIGRFTPKNGDLVVDVGANIGEYSIMAAKMVGKKGKIIAFEPNPEAFWLLQENIKLNQLENIEAINKAVCSKPGKIKIYRNLETNTMDSIKRTKTGQDYYIAKSVTLDKALESRKGINVIKIDVEGAEYAVIKGGMLTLKKKPRVIVELHSKILRNRVFSLMAESGYDLVHEDAVEGNHIAYLE